MRRIVFSISFSRQKLTVQLVFTSAKSRTNFYTQVERQSFHTACIGGLFCHSHWPILIRPHCLAGAKGFEPRHGELEVRRSRRSRGAPEPPFVEIHKLLETFEFREPYRIVGVQSFGEKWAIRRIMSRPCRLGVRSPDEESALLLGLNCQ
jgi:hypothetical protein